MARAAATIAFPPFDHDLDGATLRLVAIEGFHTATFSANGAGTVAALPTEGTLRLALEPAGFALEGDGTLRVGPLDLGPTSAGLEWAVEGTGVAGFVDPAIVINGPGAIFRLIRNDPFSSHRNRVLSIPPPTLGASGRIDLIPDNPPRHDPGPDFAVEATFTVIWSTSIPADATLPLDGAQIVTVGAIG